LKYLRDTFFPFQNGYRGWSMFFLSMRLGVFFQRRGPRLMSSDQIHAARLSSPFCLDSDESISRCFPAPERSFFFFFPCFRKVPPSLMSLSDVWQPFSPAGLTSFLQPQFFSYVRTYSYLSWTTSGALKIFETLSASADVFPSFH